MATVRGALSTLQAKLRQIGDPDLTLIANEGVTQLLKQLPGGLDDALKAAEAGGPEAREKAVPLLAKHRQFLQSDKLIAEVDANPFGEAPAVRETLTKVLAALDQRWPLLEWETPNPHSPSPAPPGNPRRCGRAFQSQPRLVISRWASCPHAG